MGEGKRGGGKVKKRGRGKKKKESKQKLFFLGLKMAK